MKRRQSSFKSPVIRTFRVKISGDKTGQLIAALRQESAHLGKAIQHLELAMRSRARRMKRPLQGRSEVQY